MLGRVFYKNLGPYYIEDIAEKIGCQLVNCKNNLVINNIKSLSESGPNDLSFFSNVKYIEQYRISNAGAVIVPMSFADTSHKDIILLRSDNSYYSYSKAVNLFYVDAQPIVPMIQPSAYVGSSVVLGKNCYIGHNVVIEDEVEIGDNCIIDSGSVIGFRVKIGNGAKISTNVSISYAQIGNNVVILSGVRIGQDGFGFATDQGVHKRIYHTGQVTIGDDVEIGANSCIDRGSIHDTVIEDLCRIDNLVQIGHNVHIKKGSILVAQAGVAGSSKVGAYCLLGGQVGIAGHVNIADNVKIAAQGGVIQDIKETGMLLGGTPAVPIRDWHKQSIIMKNLIKNKGKR